MKPSSLVVCAFVTLTACVMPLDGSEEADEGLGEQAQGIFGGQVVASGELPGVVALLIAPSSEVCSGALVHPQWVVTAAHCVAGKTPSQVQVAFDRLDIRTTGGQLVAAAAIEVNARYSAQQFGDNDIALVKLATPQLSRTRYAVSRTIPPTLTQVTIAGYGAVTAPNTGTGVLRKLTTISEACVNVGSSASDVNVMCFNANDGNGTCFGDSGGPVLVPNGNGFAVVGVTSFGANTSCTGFHAATLTAGELSFLDPFLSKPADGGGGGDEAGGCSAGGRSWGAGWWLVLLWVFARRRRAASC